MSEVFFPGVVGGWTGVGVDDGRPEAFSVENGLVDEVGDVLGRGGWNGCKEEYFFGSPIDAGEDGFGTR